MSTKTSLQENYAKNFKRLGNFLSFVFLISGCASTSEKTVTSSEENEREYFFEEVKNLPKILREDFECAMLINPVGKVIVNRGDEYRIGIDNSPIEIGDRVITLDSSSVTISYVTLAAVDLPENSQLLIDQCDATAAPLVADAGPAPIPVAAPTNYGLLNPFFLREFPEIPEISWPLPKPTHNIIVNKEWFSPPVRPEDTFGEVRERLASALEAAGFQNQWRYQEIPYESGFYIATEIERIKPFSGTPHQQRWDISRSFWDFWGGQRFRMFIFLVTREGFNVESSDKEASLGQLEKLFEEARVTLGTPPLFSEPIGNGNIQVYVYEGDIPEEIFDPIEQENAIPAKEHLKQAGILQVQERLVMASQ